MDTLISLYLKINRDRALEMLYHNYAEKIKGLCYKILTNKSEVEDAVHEIFIKIFENIDEFQFKSSIGTWIYRISLNYLLNKNKKLDFHLEFNEKILDANRFADLEIEVDLKLLDEEINRALNTLKEEDKKIFILKEFEGFQYNEIANILNMNIGTVKSRMFYIKQKLQDLLRERGY